MNRFVIGDIHGNYKALKQCLELSGFDYENDLLIQLGDIVDGWGESYECVEELLKIHNLIHIKGNHDDWFNEWLKTGIQPVTWNHGGIATLKSYGFNCLGRDWDKFQITYDHENNEPITNLNPADVPESHIKFFNSQHHYYIDEDNNCFVHGGFNRHLPMKEQSYPEIFWWDRDLWQAACGYGTMTDLKYPFKIKDNFKEIFIGHTTTNNWEYREDDIEELQLDRSLLHTTFMLPMHRANIWNLDTGAGFKGKLTIMNIDTKEYWQSDLCKDLYPNEKGRN